MPSRFSTASPPWRPSSTARLGPTTPSIAAAMIGSSKRWPQSSHEMSTSLGLTVTVPGTSAMSSKPYATLAFRPRPTHIPIDRPSRAPGFCFSAQVPHIGIARWPTYYISWIILTTPGVVNGAELMCALQAVAGLGPRRPRRASRLRTRLFIEHTQTVEPQVLVDQLDAARNVHDEPGVATRRNDPGRSTHLRSHPIDEPVDQAGVAIDGA